jgi:Tfp pilus assembly protein FimT
MTAPSCDGNSSHAAVYFQDAPMSTWFRDTDPQSGYSLAEVLVVLCCFIIFAGIAVPELDTMMDQYGITMAAQQLAIQLQSTRMKAVASNEPLRVHFLPSSNTYRVETSTGALHTGPYSLPRGTTFNRTDTNTPITFSGQYVSFLPSGNVPTSGDGSAGRVKLISRTGIRIDILVTSGGMVRSTPTYKTATPPFQP